MCIEVLGHDAYTTWRWNISEITSLINRGKVMRRFGALQFVQPGAALGEWCGLDLEDAGGVPSGFRDESHDGPGSYHVPTGYSNEVLVRGHAAAKKNTKTPGFVQF